MKILFLIVNTICDLSCRDCFYTKGYEQRTIDRIRPEQHNKFVRKIIEHNFDMVILTGGDPLCSRFKAETYELIKEFKSNHLKVILNTSAVKLNDSDIDMLLKLEVDRIDISINSKVKTIHDYERGYFDDVVWSIKTLLDRGYSAISTTTVITERNAPTAAMTIQWLLELGVRSVHYQPVFLAHEQQNYSILNAAMRECAKISGRKHTECYLLQCELAYAGQCPSRKSICQMGKTCFVCDSSGNIYPCFHRLDSPFGNILIDPVNTIDKNITHSQFARNSQQECFGKHCVSLFDNSTFWEV